MQAIRPSPERPVAAVTAILSAPDRELDYRRAKLALDSIVDPDIDSGAVATELGVLAEKALELAGPAVDDRPKLNALRRLIYESGPWNGDRPFAYDHANLRGANVRVKLISHYLETRLGDCVSMPLLFLILADRIGLNVALSTAPFHVFVRHIDPTGRATNFETTSGANPARDEWLRQSRPMSDRAIESGLYMRTLCRREGIALMATTVLQFLMDSRRYEDAVEVAEAILAHNPRDAVALVNMGCAYQHILRRDFPDDYGMQCLVPPHLQPRYQFLQLRHRSVFLAAERLGWQPDRHFALA